MEPREPETKDKRAARQEARILALLADGPQSRLGIAGKLYLSEGSVRVYLLRLRAEPRRVRVVGHARTTGRASYLYGLGSLPDVPFRRANYQAPKTGSEIAVEVLELLDTPMTTKQLAAKMGMSTSRMVVYIRKLRADRKIYVSEWMDNRGGPVKLYLAGMKPDAPKPQRQTTAQYRAKKRLKAKTWAATLFGYAPSGANNLMAHR